MGFVEFSLILQESSTFVFKYWLYFLAWFLESNTSLRFIAPKTCCMKMLNLFRFQDELCVFYFWDDVYTEQQQKKSRLGCLVVRSRAVALKVWTSFWLPAAVSSGNLLEMRILRPQPHPTDLKLWGWSSALSVLTTLRGILRYTNVRESLIWNSRSGFSKLRPVGQSGPLSIFINKVFWEYSHAHSFKCCL